LAFKHCLLRYHQETAGKYKAVLCGKDGFAICGWGTIFFLPSVAPKHAAQKNAQSNLWIAGHTNFFLLIGFIVSQKIQKVKQYFLQNAERNFRYRSQ
jgi:hypothetical protein